MPSYNQLTGDKRIELYALKKAGLKQKAIAAQLEVQPSMISPELKRNTSLRGIPPEASATLGQRIFQATWESVDEMLGKDWSPE